MPRVLRRADNSYPLSSLSIRSTAAAAAAGNVEVWLGEVERRMRASVRAQTEASLKEYPAIARTEWVKRWPAMVVLGISQVYWCRGVEGAIEGQQVDQFLEQSTQVSGVLSRQAHRHASLTRPSLHSHRTSVVSCLADVPSASYSILFCLVLSHNLPQLVPCFPSHRSPP